VPLSACKGQYPLPLLIWHDHLDHLFGLSTNSLIYFSLPSSLPPTTVLAMLRVKEVIEVINVIMGKAQQRA
jgi:hypothetical protein